MHIAGTSCKHDVWLDEIIKEYEDLKKKLKAKQKILNRVSYRIVFDAYSFPDTATNNTPHIEVRF